MVYPKLKDYTKFIFNDIRNLVYDDIQKPLYETDNEGIQQLKGLLQRIQTNYYPDYYFDELKEITEYFIQFISRRK